MTILVVLRKRHPSSGSPSQCSGPDSVQVLSDAAQTTTALNSSTMSYSTFCIQEIQFAHLVFAKEECLQTAILVKNMARNYTIHIPEIHLKSIFSNTQHFTVYVCCMSSCGPRRLNTFLGFKIKSFARIQVV